MRQAGACPTGAELHANGRTAESGEFIRRFLLQTASKLPRLLCSHAAALYTGLDSGSPWFGFLWLGLGATMKEGIHPEYREVLFVDTSTGHKFLTRSTIKTDKTAEHEGRKIPMVSVDISAASHPFFTGKQKFIDTAGRVEKFQRKYKWGQKDGEGEK